MGDRYRIELGDSLRVLATLDAASADAMVTDPPAGIGFMSKAWDRDKGGRDKWIDWLGSIMIEAKRVLRPGAHALVWALPRTSHWTATAIENAGFEIRDVVTHHFGQGFPKSLNLAKAIDRKLGAEPEVVGSRVLQGRAAQPIAEKGGTYTAAAPSSAGLAKTVPITKPTTPDAQAWEGWGTALKPASEHWILARKPPEFSIAANAMHHGTGAINVDGCRVGVDGSDKPTTKRALGPTRHVGAIDLAHVPADHTKGRWPPNALLTHALGCEVGACSPACPVAMLDAQSGTTTSTGGDGSGFDPKRRRVYQRPHGIETNVATGPHGLGKGDRGGASRFFPRFYYCPKASTREREEGLEGASKRELASVQGRKPGSAGSDNPRAGIRGKARANIHPTAKAIDLCAWLVRLVTPPGGLVLDPFAGSGSIGVACMREGVRFLGIELEPEYHQIAMARVGEASKQPRQPLGSPPLRKAGPSDARQLGLFDPGDLP